MSSEPVVILIHGTKSKPDSNWLPWLSRELTAHNIQVIRPTFPTPEGQSLANWRKTFHDAVDELSASRGRDVLPSDITLVGHSIGAAFALRLAEQSGQGMAAPYNAVIGVCPFTEPLGLDEFDPLNHSFVAPAWDWAAVRNGAKEFSFFAGNDDPYVPLATARRVRDAVGGGAFEVIDKGGHLNIDAGFTEFPALLDHIYTVLGAPQG